MRVAPPRTFTGATHAARPPAEAAGAADAFRQARFVLGDELDTVLEGLEAEASVAQDAAGSKFRNQVVAATLTAWSSAWLQRLHALHAVEWGNYLAGLVLLRSACDATSTMLGHLQTDASSWQAWLEDGIAQDATHHATAFRLDGPVPVVPSDPPAELDTLRAALDALLASPFGGAAFLTAGDSSPDRIAPTFGDRDFHVGLAEIVLGGLLRLGAFHARMLLDHADRLPIATPDRFESLIERGNRHLDRRDRCRIEVLTGDDAGRYLVQSMRRGSAGAPKRYLL